MNPPTWSYWIVEGMWWRGYEKGDGQFDILWLIFLCGAAYRYEPKVHASGYKVSRDLGEG
jgi:hypothetical protein